MVYIKQGLPFANSILILLKAQIQTFLKRQYALHEPEHYDQ
jgi:hypothetical protein